MLHGTMYNPPLRIIKSHKNCTKLTFLCELAACNCSKLAIRKEILHIHAMHRRNSKVVLWFSTSSNAVSLMTARVLMSENHWKSTYRRQQN